MKRILVTGGLGFIGSETTIELIKNGYEPVVVDNLFNSKSAVLDRIEELTKVRPAFYQVDCCDEKALEKVFGENEIDAVIHFAGYKAVAESVEKPLEYYRNNLLSSIVVLRLMKRHDVHGIIFSSSATVYGVPSRLPLVETDPVQEATNPYGETKIMIERIIEDEAKADPDFKGILLRYFNPIGAHPSGLLGEDPNGIPNNLMPYVSQVAIGRLNHLNVNGDDYPTPDGTGVRDYIHVVDLARGHVAALKRLETLKGVDVYNLGTGRGTSVLEVVKAFEKATGVKIPYVIAPRRPGDVASNYADCSKAERELHWRAVLTVEDACRDAYNFQKMNPEGIK